MRHTRNRQMRKLRKDWPWKVNVKIKQKNSPFEDKSFRWHSESVEYNFWSNWRKSCVSFDYKSSHPNAVGMATKYLPTKERN